MILNDKKIKEYIKSKKIIVEPFDEDLVGPASLDIRLGYKFRVFKNVEKEYIDIKNYNDDIIFRSENDNFTIHHGIYSDLYIAKNENVPVIIHSKEFVLASVYEYVKLPDNIAAQISGRSSLARLGIFVHTSAGWIDPGYSGHLTLEIYNANKIPIKIYPMTRIAQITFFEIEPVEMPYDRRASSKYVEEEGANYSKISEEFK